MEEGRVLSKRIRLLESSKAHENLAVKEIPIRADALASWPLKDTQIPQKLSTGAHTGPPSV